MMATQPRFSTVPRLGFTAPPRTPPVKPTFGSYCLKASCDIQGGVGCPIGKVIGYHTSPVVGQLTEQQCRLQCERLGPGFSCTPATVQLLPQTRAPMDCSGQVYFVLDGETTRLV